MDKQWFEDPRDTVRLSSASPSDISDYYVPKQSQVVPSSISEEGWVTSNPRTTKRHHHEAGRLQERLDTFQRQAANVFQASTEGGDDDSWDSTPVRELHVGVEFDGIGEDDNDNEEPPSAAETRNQTAHADAETMSLHLPSYLGRDWCNRNSAEDLAKAELRLREGQLNDSLHHIRIALGHKSYLFRNDVRPARSQRLKTRAWAGVHAVESTVQHHARVYTRARQAMVDLGAAANILDRYKS